MKDFVSEIKKIKQKAREQVLDGALTYAYGADLEKVIALLNQALATEVVCVLRYRFHYESAKGMNSMSIAEEFLEHADNEQEHVNKIATRISQLGGKPNFNPAGLAERSQTDYVEGNSLREMINEDLIAERIVIGIYQECIRYIDNGDPTTRRLFEDILADEEEHATELSDLLSGLDEGEGKMRPPIRRESEVVKPVNFR